jgi:HK97 family phage portal protein
MRFFGLEITRSKKNAPNWMSNVFGGGGWFPVVREPFGGAWQRNLECSPETALSHTAVFACITRISSDIGKMALMLVAEVEDDVYEETTSPAFSPVLNKPNSFQTHIDFKESWIISKLRTGNTFVLKQRDNRGVVTALHVLNPLRVQPLVATDGSIFYQLSADNISELPESVVVPASEIIHDRMNCLFHPLIGISPLFAAALPAAVGLEIEKNSARFYLNGAKISGIITAPGNIGDEQASELKKKFNAGYTGENAGKVAILGDGLKFTQLTMSSVDAQMIEQLKMSDLQVCTVFQMPPHKVGVGTMPSYDNIEALNQQYLSDCLQTLIEKMEQLLEEGLGIKDPYDILLDTDALLRMDQKTQMNTLGEGVARGMLAPNDARKKLGLRKAAGGDTPYLQQQNFSLKALSKRDSLDNPFVIDRPTSNPTPSADGSPATADPAQAPPAKAITVDILEAEFELVTASIAPLSLPAPIHSKAA